MAAKIICLYGNKGVGKSSVADRLGEFGWVRMSLAQPIRDMLSCLLPDEYVGRFADKDRPLSQLGGKSVRYALMTLGTEWGRNLMDEDIWVQLLLDRIADSGEEKVVIDDSRMQNEYNILKYYGATFVRIRREPIDSEYIKQRAEDSKKGVALHESEAHWPLWTPDFVSVNSTPTICAEHINDFCTPCE